MLLTIDTAKIDTSSIETLAALFESRAALCEHLHLSGAVPDGHEFQLLDEADEHRQTAFKLRDEVAKRRGAYLIRHAQLMKV